jgi:hypothetical protein
MGKTITNKQLIRLQAGRIMKNQPLKKRLDELYYELYKTWNGYPPSLMGMSDDRIHVRIAFCRRMEEWYAF